MIDEEQFRSMSDERFDFRHPTPLRKAYIIASSARSGSTFLARSLAQTGLLGAPSEALNSKTNDVQTFMTRFKVYSHAEYIAKLLAHRTSRNGVFGIKAHFHQFEAFLKKYPGLLEALAPLSYIYIERRDKVAQAVSMARALQTSQWSSQWRGISNPVLNYDREMIAKAMNEVELQSARWLQWFDLHKIEPIRVIYEELIDDPHTTVRAIVEQLGVQDDEPDEVQLPPVEKQGDDTNQEWIERFTRETRGETERPEAEGAQGALAENSGSRPSTAPGDFFDRYAELIKRLPLSHYSATDFVASIRQRRRYEAIVGQNRALFRGARVLDLVSLQGFWSLAALDAGAAHVLAVETSHEAVEATKRNLGEFWTNPKAYQTVNAKIMKSLEGFSPGQFDVILCKSFLEHSNPVEVFQHLSRLRPRHVILDIQISGGDHPQARLSLAEASGKGRKDKIACVPNHDLIVFLSSPDFQWRLIDWQAMGITDWTGLPDYARGKRRTYVLDRAS